MTPAAKLIRLTYIALLILALLAPMIGLYPVFVMKLLCFAIFASAFNLLLGFTGLLSFGHAAFFGSAAYITGWLIKMQHWTPELGILAGMLGAGVIGVVVGLVAIRRQGIYFAMITMAIAQMVFFVCLQRPSPVVKTACKAYRAALSSAGSRWPRTPPCITWWWPSLWQLFWPSRASCIHLSGKS